MKRSQQQPEPKVTAYPASEQPRARVDAESPSELDPELARRVEEAAFRFGQFINGSRFSRATVYQLTQIIAACAKPWFETAIRLYGENTRFELGTPKCERAGALDVWISISIHWMQAAHVWHTLVFCTLYQYMRACGAPLPANDETATRTRKRILRKLREALDPGSDMSGGWRFNWLGGYPLTANTLRHFAPLPVRRQRVSH